MNPPPKPRRGLSPEAIRVIVRVGLFVLVVGLGRLVFPVLMESIGNLLAVSALTNFGAGALANAALSRMYEEGRISSVGLQWTPQSTRDLLMGVIGGAGGAAFILLTALALRIASYGTATPGPAGGVNVVFLLVLLLFGACGEELVFHGYAFQLLTRTAGPFAAVLPVGVLFGVLHLGNENVTFLAVVNTVAWGILLGCAFLRTGALWLSIGLHFGWNAAMPLIGVNLSGFTMGVVGYELHWRVSDLWSGGAYGFEGGLFTTLVVIGLFFLLWRGVPGEVPEDSAAA